MTSKANVEHSTQHKNLDFLKIECLTRIMMNSRKKMKDAMLALTDNNV